jgi:hypothetical protein
MVAPPPKVPKRPSGVSSGVSPASGSTIWVILPPPSSKKHARVVFEDADEDADEDKDKKKPKKEKQEKPKRDKKAAPTRKFLILFSPFEELIICSLFRLIPHLSHPPRSPIYAVLPSSTVIPALQKVSGTPRVVPSCKVSIIGGIPLTT